MPSNHLIICRPLLLLPSIFPSIRAFSNESVLRIRWPKYWSFSISPSNEYSGLISFRINWFDLLAVQGTFKSLLSTTIQKYQFFDTQLSLWSNSHIHTQSLPSGSFHKLLILIHQRADRMKTTITDKRLKHLPAMRETWVRSLGREDPLEKEMATHSSILAWRIPWMEELGGLQSMGSQRVGHD